MHRHSLRRNGGIVAFEQLTVDEIKTLIQQWVSNSRTELVRAELAQLLTQIVGVTGGSDGVINSIDISGNTATAGRTVGGNVVGAVDLTGQTEIVALQDKIVTSIAFTGTDTKTLTLTFADATTLTANFTDSGGTSQESTYDLLSGDVKVTGSSGITAGFSAGVFTITMPAGGVLRCLEIDVEVADAVYTNGLVSNAVKVVIDNSANNDVANNNDAGLIFNPVFRARTAAGTINSGNPLQWNAAINTSIQGDEHGGGIRSWIFQQVPANASAGGFINM